MNFGIAVLWIVALGVVSGANADCLSRCLGGCGASVSDGPYCQEVKNRCSAQCVGKGSHDYGAIAYSPSTGANGWSNKSDTREEAENTVAVAAGEKEVSWGLGNTAREAQLSALEKCRQGEDHKCELRASVCSRGPAD